MPSTAVYPLSLHDALPIFRVAKQHARLHRRVKRVGNRLLAQPARRCHQRSRELGGDEIAVLGKRRRRFENSPEAKGAETAAALDRKSTRLNSSHTVNSYAVHRRLPPFPTRRSSDLPGCEAACPPPSAGKARRQPAPGPACSPLPSALARAGG